MEYFQLQEYWRTQCYSQVDGEIGDGLSLFYMKSLISPFQHDFLKGRSTVTNLFAFTTHVFRNFLVKAQTDVIYIDFSKAFDRVNYGILLLKLSLNGIPATWYIIGLAPNTPLGLKRYCLGIYCLRLYMLFLLFRKVAIWILYYFYCFCLSFAVLQRNIDLFVF